MEETIHIIVSIAILIIIIILAYLYGKNKPQKRMIDPIRSQEIITKKTFNKYKQDVLDFLIPYVKPLAIKEKQLIHKDDYGDYVFDDWLNEQDRFIKNKMHFLMLKIANEAKHEFDTNISLVKYQENYRKDIHGYIDEEILENIKTIINKLVDEYRKRMIEENSSFEYNLDDPYLFEKSVEENFELFGWEAQGTPKSGDQGADVIAELNGYKVIVQCKLYSKPVGNKAVQEVISANQFFHGNLALVVSNASFTKSAKQLADSTDVILLHYSLLSDFLTKLDV